jgi:hypothetical protein
MQTLVIYGHSWNGGQRGRYGVHFQMCGGGVTVQRGPGASVPTDCPTGAEGLWLF